MSTPFRCEIQADFVVLIKKNAFVLAAVLAVGLALPGLVFAQNYPPSVGQLVAATKKQVKTINMAEFKAAHSTFRAA
jgi:hypothetical protein